MLRAIIVVVMDCLRADHLSGYGYARPTTPTIDALGEHGVIWDRAYSLSSWTKPSVTSLLTGLYPSEHGAFLGVKRSKGRRRAMTNVLQSSRPTLAESFSAAGWRCGAFINNAQLGEFTQLNRGFQTYQPYAGKADHLLAAFDQWLLREPQRPALAYLHFLETHWPYKPRRRHIAMFGGNRDTNCFRDYSARDFGKLRRALGRSERKLTESEREQLVQMYDGAARRLDGKVKVLLRMLEEAGLADDTAVIVTADHGEEFLDHGRIGHGHSLYDELIHVPLVARVPHTTAGGRRGDPVSLVDLPSTLLHLAKIEPDGNGANLMDGTGPTSPVCAELCTGNRYTQMLRVGDWKLHRRFRFQVPDNGVLDPNGSPRTWIDCYAHSVHCELYDTAHDPGEHSNLIDDSRYRDARDRMLSRLDRWWASHGSLIQGDLPNAVEIDERVVGRLRDLGYID